MSRIDHIYALHNILRTRRTPISKADLQARLDCSAATVGRLLQELRDYLRAPVETVRGEGYRYFREQRDDYELPGLWFNDSELLALLSMQQLMQEIEPGLLTGKLKPLQQRIEDMLTAHGHSVTELSQRIRLEPVFRRNRGGKAVIDVAAAVLGDQRISIDYHDRSRDQTSQRELSPQRLKFYRDNWYLLAWCHQRNNLRSFAIERIRNLQLLDKPARQVESEQLDQAGAGFGIMSGTQLHTAVLNFSAFRARWVAEEQWHPQQQSCWLDDGRYQLQLPYANQHELVLDILRYGADVEVVAPPELRQAVVRQLLLAAELYQ